MLDRISVREMDLMIIMPGVFVTLFLRTAGLCEMTVWMGSAVSVLMMCRSRVMRLRNAEDTLIMISG